MRYFCAILVVFGFLLPSNACALEAFGDLLYWRATESVDWALTNNLNSQSQDITYKTIAFNYDPGFRVGVGANNESNWDAKLYYTRFYTRATDAATGNVTSGFIGGKLNQAASSFFYQSGQVDFTIDFNMIDLNVGKHLNVADVLMVRPFVGIEGGWIDQTVNTAFQGLISGTENITNDFTGIGPKVGIENRLTLLCTEDVQLDLAVDFSAAYLWGRWKINDVFRNVNGGTIIVPIANRSFGALAVQGLAGINIDYKNFSLKLGYEINDWFNQCQIFSDASGPQNNDLILQGLTLRLSYDF